MPAPDTPETAQDPELVREALEALLEIAWNGNPPEVVGALREQAAQLSDQERAHMLDGLLDREVLSRRLAEARDDQLPTPNALPLEDTQEEMVDAALEPLVGLVEPEARETVQDLSAPQRAAILFKAVNRQG